MIPAPQSDISPANVFRISDYFIYCQGSMFSNAPSFLLLMFDDRFNIVYAKTIGEQVVTPAVWTEEIHD